MSVNLGDIDEIWGSSGDKLYNTRLHEIDIFCSIAVTCYSVAFFSYMKLAKLSKMGPSALHQPTSVIYLYVLQKSMRRSNGVAWLFLAMCHVAFGY